MPPFLPLLLLLAQQGAEWVDGPAAATQPPLYAGAREPLATPRFLKLPTGSIRPAGWLRACLERQRDGLTGALPGISAWLQKEGNAWLSPDGEGSWGWEEVPYWLRGALEIGYLLDDHALLAEAQVWIEGALASQREDGDFGPVRRFDDDQSRDFWANMVMLHCLRTHYEATGDPRVIELMLRTFRYQLTVPDELFLTHYWQNRRGGDELDVVHWLYERTGEAFLLELAAKLHRNTLDWRPKGRSADLHNVNVAQGFREPAQWWRQSGDPADRQATYDAFRVVRERYGQVPGGMFGGDEDCRPGCGDPRQAIETCGLVEQMRSDELLLRITGDPFWADHCEEVAFNQLPGAFLPDFRGLRYLQSPNQVTSDAANHAPGLANRGPFLVMSAVSHRCCQHNHSHGFSSFAESLWTATPDRGLCASLYAASRVRARAGTGQEVRLTTDTRYPFDEDVRVRVDCLEPERFPLYLRVPAWCAAPELWLNGERLALNGRRAGFLRLTRDWRAGDRVRLRLPMDVRVRTWQANHDSVSVYRGPLVFGLRIEERRVERDAAETALADSRWRDDLDLAAWPSVELFPASPWNYGLPLSEEPAASFTVERGPWPEDDFPFTLRAAPVRLRASGRRIPEWQLDRYGLCAELQASPVHSDEPDETIELVPMGAARLRITAFPVVAAPNEGDGGGVRWQPPAMPKRLYAASASHCWDGDDVQAVADDLVPADSDDHSIPRHTFWPRRGGTEWLQADLEAPRSVRGVAVYWFDDRDEAGGCRVPASARLLMRAGDGWRPVPGAAAIGVERDRFNAVGFPALTTDALRLEVTLQDGFSAGVLEWRIE
jgi:Beta-L-arabinofuranosidase, GH127 catalytic domain/Beta-L-arabinofuranosidase, GH127 middle domain